MRQGGEGVSLEGLGVKLERQGGDRDWPELHSKELGARSLAVQLKGSGDSAPPPELLRETASRASRAGAFKLFDQDPP